MSSVDEPGAASDLGLMLAAPEQLKTGLSLMQSEFVAMDKAAAGAAVSVDNAGGALVDPTVPVAAGKLSSLPSDAVAETNGAADSGRRASARSGLTLAQEPDTATLGTRGVPSQQLDERQLSDLKADAHDQSAMQGGSDRQTVEALLDQRSAFLLAMPDMGRSSAEQTAPVIPIISNVPVAVAPVQDSEVDGRKSQIDLLDESFDAQTVVSGDGLEVTDAPVIGSVSSAVNSVRLGRLAGLRVDVPDLSMGPQASSIMRSVQVPTMSRASVDDGMDGEAGAEDGFKGDGAVAPSGGREKDNSGGGAVILDGRLVGEWLTERMARQALRPGAGTTFFDVRQGPAWTPSGAW